MSRQFTVTNPLPPLWLRYPGFSRYCLGWRMGAGEDYKYRWGDWFAALSTADQTAYIELFPAPATWADFYQVTEDDFEPDNIQGYLVWRANGQLKYMREQFIAQGKSFSHKQILCFWKPDTNALISKACFGQWQPSPFAVDADEYACAEQFMMAEKAMLFGDEAMRRKILATDQPKAMKAFGQKVQNFEQSLWDQLKATIVLQGNYYKFAQNPQMRDFLLATGDKLLIEASPLDRIWGVGLAEDNPNILNPATWRGQNLLGFVLMEVRDELRRVYANYDKIDWPAVQKL